MDPAEIIARALTIASGCDNVPDHSLCATNPDGCHCRCAAQAALKALEDAGLCVTDKFLRDAGLTWYATHPPAPATPSFGAAGVSMSFADNYLNCNNNRVAGDRNSEVSQASMIRICPERDGPCPHGMSCPYSVDRWRCDQGARHHALVPPHSTRKHEMKATEIPEDIEHAAEDVFATASLLSDPEAVIGRIASAILAERTRCLSAVATVGAEAKPFQKLNDQYVVGHNTACGRLAYQISKGA